MRVREIMTTPAVVVKPDAPVKAVVEVMVENHVSGVPVVDDGGGLVGVVTQADLLPKEAHDSRPPRLLGAIADLLANRDPAWRTKANALVARDLMTSRVVTTGPDVDVRKAARRMMEARVTRLPVVEDGQVVGVLARQDLLELFHRPDTSLAAAIETVLADVLAVPEDSEVAAAVQDGVVTLAGEVARPSDIPVVEAAVWRVPGVVGVIPRLIAREPEVPAGHGHPIL